MTDPKIHSDLFYQSLKSFSDFRALADASLFEPIPEDWYLVLSDIKGSTKAIAEGRYKEVNTVGAATIMAVFNSVKPLAVPFIFGGDGATLCVPESVLDRVKVALLATQAMALSEFNLDLRVAVIPVSAILASGQKLLVAKYQISPHVSHAVFTGGGVQYAEHVLKDIEKSRPYTLTHSSGLPKNKNIFSGLECRWEPLGSPSGEFHTLIVLALKKSSDENKEIYEQVLNKIDEIYSKKNNPVQKPALTLGKDLKTLRNELNVRTSGRNLVFKILYFLKMKVENFVGKILFKSNLRLGGVEWNAYLPDLVTQTDYKKFDDTLRYILSGNSKQREQLEEFLSLLQSKGDLVYGLHVSDKAMLTCLIFQRNHQHLHFVDGSDGGYAMAAKMMKDNLQKHRSLRRSG